MASAIAKFQCPSPFAILIRRHQPFLAPGRFVCCMHPHRKTDWSPQTDRRIESHVPMAFIRRRRRAAGHSTLAAEVACGLESVDAGCIYESGRPRCSLLGNLKVVRLALLLVKRAVLARAALPTYRMTCICSITTLCAPSMRVSRLMGVSLLMRSPTTQPAKHCRFFSRGRACCYSLETEFKLG